ncbi:MAG: PD-(D/E)XK nuclease family protein, partial [Candidatus Omnitrophica bacterium]|nr:PD-(D/E)XK nuclease family protein [Candidatus Omnitrophota bacterium]
MAIYSHSQLSTYETCPLQYKFNYIDKIRREEQGIEAFMGNCFHETMALLYKDLNFSIHAVDELLSYYDERWDKEYSDKVIIVKKNKTVDDYRSIGKKCIQDYYKSYHPFDQAKVLGIERQVNFDLDEEGRYKLKGYIDRIDLTGDGTYEIHDYKTSGFLPEQSQADKDRQLALYEIGLRKMWNDADRVRLVWHYVVFDKELSSARTDEDLNKLKSDTISLINEIEKVKEFKPKESYLCGWCSYKRFCPKKKHLVKVTG